MLNVLGGVKIYTAPEVDKLIGKASGHAIVVSLPPLASAMVGTVYYKKTAVTKKELKGYRKASDTEGDYTSDLRASPEGEYTVAVYDRYSMLVPYIVGTDSSGNRAWYTTGTLDSSGPITEEEVLQIWRDAEPKKEHINVGGNQ